MKTAFNTRFLSEQWNLHNKNSQLLFFLLISRKEIKLRTNVDIQIYRKVMLTRYLLMHTQQNQFSNIWKSYNTKCTTEQFLCWYQIHYWTKFLIKCSVLIILITVYWKFEDQIYGVFEIVLIISFYHTLYLATNNGSTWWLWQVILFPSVLLSNHQ